MSVKIIVDVERNTKVHVEVDVPESQLLETADAIAKRVADAFLADDSERST